MGKINFIEDLKRNDIIVEELEFGKRFKIVFDNKYTEDIRENLKIHQNDLEFFLIAAKNKAVFEQYTTNFIAEPSIENLHTIPYSFIINAPIPIVGFFAERIVNIK
ncbi:hypothetical protein ACMGD3_07490 [Lysinibacillus sphaericus]|uniref:hypothetical protein n=1 Tax=Lysinibacillus sphaericus TaxID=1421 RepID=UPI003F7978EA